MNRQSQFKDISDIYGRVIDYYSSNSHFRLAPNLEQSLYDGKRAMDEAHQYVYSFVDNLVLLMEIVKVKVNSHKSLVEKLKQNGNNREVALEMTRFMLEYALLPSFIGLVIEVVIAISEPSYESTIQFNHIKELVKEKYDNFTEILSKTDNSSNKAYIAIVKALNMPGDALGLLVNLLELKQMYANKEYFTKSAINALCAFTPKAIEVSEQLHIISDSILKLTKAKKG